VQCREWTRHVAEGNVNVMLRIYVRMVCLCGLVLAGCDDPELERSLAEQADDVESVESVESVELAAIEDEDEEAEPAQSLLDEFADPVDGAAFAEACVPDTTCAGPKTCSPWSGYSDCDAAMCVGYHESCDTFVKRQTNGGSPGALKSPRNRYRNCTMKSNGAACTEWQQSNFYSCGHGC
jgi:hypothetical protein